MHESKHCTFYLQGLFLADTFLQNPVNFSYFKRSVTAQTNPVLQPPKMGKSDVKRATSKQVAL